MRVFLSYRREDSSAWAGRLRDGLVVRLGEDSVFQDVVTIRPGQSFTTAIEAAMAHCDATIVVIGPRWLDVTDGAGGRRLARPDDSVRQELAFALADEKLVVPVLVGGAAMPTIDQLPPELRALAERQAVALREDSWHDDVERLVRALRGEPARWWPHRWLFAAAGFTLVVVAAGVLVSLLADDDESGGGPTSSAAPNTTIGPFEINAPACVSPQPPDWTDLGMEGTSPEDPDKGWAFEVLGGGYRQDESDRWEVVLHTRAVRQGQEADTHYPFYSLIANGETSRPYCFNVVDGPRAPGPGESSDAYVGFTMSDEPTGALSLDTYASGQGYRIDLTSDGTG